MRLDTLAAPGFRKFWTLVFAMMLAGIGAAAAQDADVISGKPEVIDADVLKFDTQRVILWAVDAPERKQTCYADGALWGCYEASRRLLELLAGRGEVTCKLQGDPDPFGRRFGICESGGQDLNAELVRAGLALAYEEQSDIYVLDMADAITAGVGLWQPGIIFEEPWVFRRRETPGGFR